MFELVLASQEHVFTLRAYDFVCECTLPYIPSNSMYASNFGYHICELGMHSWEHAQFLFFTAEHRAAVPRQLRAVFKSPV